MEWVFFLSLLLAFLIGKGIYDRRSLNYKTLNKIRREYGTLNHLSDEDYVPVFLTDYFKSKQDTFVIDDITANDLSFDDIFLILDKTMSGPGSEYLYSMIRTPVFDSEALKKRENLIEFFSHNKDAREKTLLALVMSKKTKKISYFSCTGLFKNADIGNGFKHYLCIVCLILSVVSACVFKSALFIALPVISVCVNMVTYFADKSKMSNYIYGMKCALAMIKSGEKIAFCDFPELKDEIDILKECNKKLSPLKHAAWAINTNVSGDLLSIFMDYVNMIFHFDLISVSRAIKCASENEETLLKMFETLGMLDSVISVCNLRASSYKTCVPEIGNGNNFEFTGAYHVLLKNPVPVSLSESKNILLTGSNASGKSTFLKTVATNAIFAETIHTCFADEFKMPYYKVISSMALNDSIILGESYYVTEIKALKRIIDASTDIPVLCFVDEVLRGTNTTERIAAQVAALKFLAKGNRKVFAATHDTELTGLLKEYYENYHFEESINDDNEITFDYMLKPGPSTTKNAILMLKAYGYDQKIIDDAVYMSDYFAKNMTWNTPED